MSDLKERIEELEDKYNRLMRERKDEEGTQVWQKIEELRDRLENEEEQELEVSFDDLDGVGEELADELADDYDSLADLSEADPEELEKISGIGEKRAESIIEQAGGY